MFYNFFRSAGKTKEQAANSDREAKFMADKNKQASILAAEKRELARQEKIADQLEAEYKKNEAILVVKEEAYQKELGSLVHNTQIKAYKSNGQLANDIDIRDVYLEAYDLGLKYDVIPCFEIHVNMWSEDFLRVSKVGRMVE